MKLLTYPCETCKYKDAMYACEQASCVKYQAYKKRKEYKRYKLKKLDT